MKTEMMILNILCDTIFKFGKMEPETIVINGKKIRISLDKFGSDNDYFSLTDLAKLKKGTKNTGSVISNWFKNKRTRAFLEAWETENNPNFKKPVDIGMELSLNQWIEASGAVGIVTKKGRFGGTSSPFEVAAEFAGYLSPSYKVAIKKKYKELTDLFNNYQRCFYMDWCKETLCFLTYVIKEYIIDKYDIPKDQHDRIYDEEIDIVNQVAFGMTDREWMMKNPYENPNLKGDITDHMTTRSLGILNRIQLHYGLLIKIDIPKEERILSIKRDAESMHNNPYLYKNRGDYVKFDPRYHDSEMAKLYEEFG